MRVRHFKLFGIRRLDGLSADLPRTQDTDLVVLHGGRGSGKTTLLDTLAACTERVTGSGAWDSRWDSLAASGPAKVALDWEAAEEERARFALTDPLLSTEIILGAARSATDSPVALRGILGEVGTPTRGSLHYLHDGRALEGPVPYGADEAAFRQRLLNRNTKFGNLYDMLDQSEMASARTLATARLAELCPHLSIDGLRRFGTSFAPMIRDASAGGEARTADKLSASERQAFLLALYTSRVPIVDSVILLDAPELGFGDAGAVDFVRALLRWTTRTQLIVATASDAVRAMPETAHTVELAR